jgi:cardiolipin synthase A/B
MFAHIFRTLKRPVSVWLGAALLMCLALVGCQGGATGAQTTGAPNAAGRCTGWGCGTTTATLPAGLGARRLSVFVEPEAGEGPVLHAIESAQKSVWVEAYLLTDRNVINAVEDAANRAVDVRVLLELNPYGSGATSPHQPAGDAARVAGGGGEGQWVECRLPLHP